MKYGLIAALLLLGACGPSQPQAPVEARSTPRPPVQETERHIRQSSEQWAAGDVAAMKSFLADDYEGVASTGEVRNKARQIELASEPSPFSATRVDYVNFRHFGDMVIAPGAETLTPENRAPDRRLIWTDIWMFRDGRWQVVASQDSVRPPTT